MVAHICNPAIQKVNIGGLWFEVSTGKGACLFQCWVYIWERVIRREKKSAHCFDSFYWSGFIGHLNTTFLR
jgi:hypothetical protein